MRKKNYQHFLVFLTEETEMLLRGRGGWVWGGEESNTASQEPRGSKDCQLSTNNCPPSSLVTGPLRVLATWDTDCFPAALADSYRHKAKFRRKRLEPKHHVLQKCP